MMVFIAQFFKREKLEKVYSKIRHFFFYKDESCKVKYNLIFSICIFCFFFLADFVLVLLDRMNFVPEFILSAIIIIACFLFSFCNLYLKVVISTIVFIFLLINVNCITYIGRHITYDEIRKIFIDTGDIGSNFIDVWWIEPFIILPYLVVLFLSVKWRKKFYKSVFIDVLILYGFYWIYKIALPMDNRHKLPVGSKPTIINSFRVIPYFLVHFKDPVDNKYPEEVKKPYKIELVNKNTPRVVFLIWGESTNAEYQSFLGDSKFLKGFKTTPKIQSLIDNEKDKYVAMKAISSGCETQGSTELFFNLFAEPMNFTEVASSYKQNIFDLAKANGYYTHFLSADKSNVMEIGQMHADQLINRDTHMSLLERDRDDYLLKKMYELDLSKGKHFVVIQFQTAHERFEESYYHHKEFEVFKPNINDDRRTDFRKKYKNAMLRLDDMVYQVINFAKKNGAEYVFYTSDHGDALGVDYNNNDGKEYGHGRLGFIDMVVPFLLYQKKPDLNISKKLLEKKVLTHIEISELLVNILGYKIERPNKENDIFYMYGSVPFNKHSLMKQIKRTNGEMEELYHGTMADFFKQKYNFLSE